MDIVDLCRSVQGHMHMCLCLYVLVHYNILICISVPCVFALFASMNVCMHFILYVHAYMLTCSYLRIKAIPGDKTCTCMHAYMYHS